MPRELNAMAWTYLLVAGLFEMGWAISLKYAQGFTKLWPSVLTLALMSVSLGLLSLAVRTIPVGTGYAIWTSIGAVGTATLGIVLFAEPVTLWRVSCLLLIVAGIVGLKVTAS
jgi:quaternary ammonium compound-resistance protein SugE